MEVAIGAAVTIGLAIITGMGALAYSLVFVFFVWLRDDFARYADKD